MSDRRDLPARPAGAEVAEPPAEPPVVARLIVEIRSDGSRTIARGAVEDVEAGQRTAVKVEGTTPLALALSLAKALFLMPALARDAARALLQSHKK